MATKLCLWGTKDSEDMIRQCFTHCHNPKVVAIATDEFCVSCPYRTLGGIAEKLSQAIAEMEKLEYFADAFRCLNYELIVYIGKRTFNKLEAENDSKVVVCNTYYLHQQYRFEGYEILFAPEEDKLELVVRHRLGGNIVERKEVDISN